MFQLFLKRAVPVPCPESFTDYLFIGPHPDDIETACAPTVLSLTRLGKRVQFLIVTDGSAGSIDPNADITALIQTRREESLQSARLLGVSDVTFLTLPDGSAYTEDTCTSLIAQEIARLRPDAVFAPDPDVRSECHPDHLKVGRATKSVALLGGYPLVMRQWNVAQTHAIQALFLYYTDRPNAFLNVTSTHFVRKEALSLHKSQFSPELLAMVLRYFSMRAIRYGWKRHCLRCDAYRALAPTHMHCFPEASKW